MKLIYAQAEVERERQAKAWDAVAAPDELPTP